MPTGSEPSLLRPRDPRWREINEHEGRDARAWARQRTIPELIEAGLALSATAHAILLATAGARRDARPA